MSNPRRNPNGHLRRHPDTVAERWQAIVKYPDPDKPGGWKQRSKTFEHKADAQEWLDVTLVEHRRSPGYRQPSDELFAVFLARWLDDVAAGRVQDTTLDGYRAMTKYINPRLGSLPLSRITTLDIQGLYTHLLKQGKATSTIRQTHVVVRGALSSAEEWGLIPVNPALRARPPKVQPPRLAVPTVEQAQILLRAVANDRLKALWYFIALTGCRRGEALGLFWTDVNWDAGTATITRALVGKARKRTLHDPKTVKGRRTMDLGPELVQILRAHRDQQRLESQAAGPNWQDSGYVFTTRTGGRLDPDGVRKRFKVVLKQAGLPRTIRIHDLRHFLATVWLAHGVQGKVVSERLGHASSVITDTLYAHVMPGMQAAAARKMEAFLLDGVTATFPDDKIDPV